MKAFLVICTLVAVAMAAKPIEMDLDNSIFHLKITGNSNVPKYSFYRTDQGRAGGHYELNFNYIYECDTECKVVGNKKSLAALEWSFGPIENTDEEMKFDMLSSGSPGFFNSIVLSNHLKNNESDAAPVEFDITIDGMTWVNPNASLCMDYRLHTANGPENETVTVNDAVVATDGAATFGIVPMAYDQDGNTVPAVLVGNEHKITVVYGHFNTSLFHDPWIGIDTDDENGIISGAHWMVPSLLLIAMFLLF